MGRRPPGHSRGHRIVCLGDDNYEISWTLYFYWRFPRRVRRYTNEKGALRFCKKWGLTKP